MKRYKQRFREWSDTPYTDSEIVTEQTETNMSLMETYAALSISARLAFKDLPVDWHVEIVDNSVHLMFHHK